MGIGVGVPTGQLNILAFAVHQFHKVLGQDRGPLEVVGYDLRYRYAIFRDLAVNQEAGDTCVLGLLHRGNRGVGTGILQNDGGCAASDSRVKQLVLFVGIVVVNQGQCLIA